MAGSEARRNLFADGIDGGDGGGENDVLGLEDLLQGGGIGQSGQFCGIAVVYTGDLTGGQVAVNQLAEAPIAEEADIIGAHNGAL